MRLAPGDKVDRYVVERQVGEGAMAIVFQVRHETLDTVHALKVLTQTQSPIVERLVQEGRVQASLRHPNVVAVTDVLDVGGMPGLLMEYIDGPSLKEWLFAVRPSLPEALRLFRGVAAGVGRAHDLEIIHRDLKPGNVMLQDVNGQLEPKVADFGLAKALDSFSGSQGMQQTRTGSAMGTPAYMAPEQIRDAKNVDQRADLFSLGALLYELVTGQLAFPGDDLFEVFSKVVAGRCVPPEILVPDLPAPVLRAIHGCLQPDREQRLASCAEVLAVLDGDIVPGHPAERLGAPLPVGRPAVGATGGVAAAPLTPSSPVSVPTSQASVISHPTMDHFAAGVQPLGSQRAQETATLSASAPPAVAPTAPVEPEPRKKPLWLLGMVALVGVAGVVALSQGSGEPPPVSEPAPAVTVTLAPPPLPQPVDEPERVVTPEPALEPTPVVAKRPVRPKPAPVAVEPEPVVEPEPEPAGPAPAVVRQTGADRVVLIGGAGRFPPGEVPPGRYSVEATFGGSTVNALQMSLSPGEQVTIACDAAFKMCKR